MPKKSNDQKARARELFETEGFSLVEIANRLEIKATTLRAWKAKDKKNGDEWNAPKQKKKRENVPQRSLDNLEPVQKGEQKALKHGLYSKYLNPQAAEIYNGLTDEEDELTWLREAIKIKLANYIGGQRLLDFSAHNDVKADSNAAHTIATMIKEYKILKSKIGNTNTDDGFIEALERSGLVVWDDEDL